jgi:predicted dehydrogenase
MEKTLTYGMVGGGEGAFIGDVHRRAIALEGGARLVAGCFSRDPAITRSRGLSLGLDEERLYETPAAMAAGEAARKDRIDFVVVVTPNASHHAIAAAFLDAGIPVVCDKPLVTNSRDAADLARRAAEKTLPFCVTYTYSGYPMVKEARALLRSGELGSVRFVNAEYAQEWLTLPLERAGNRQASWRTDPSQAGAGSTGDIGTHVEHLVSYVTELEMRSLSARLDTFVEGRAVDDNATVLVEYAGGAKGLYWFSQVAVGSANGLKLRVLCEKGSLAWEQENPNVLQVARLGQPVQSLSRGRDSLSAEALGFSRIPGGHPEGYYEAFANIYRAFLEHLRCPAEPAPDYPGIAEGARGVRFVERCLESSAGGGRRLDF